MHATANATTNVITNVITISTDPLRP